MTDVFLQGTTATLVVRWYEYPGGPSTDVQNVEIEITPLVGGAAVIGPTGVGVTHPTTGTDVYNWVVSSAQAPGNYLVEWTGDDPAVSGTGTATASEIVVIAASTGSEGNVTGPCEVWTPRFAGCSLPTGSEAVSGIAAAAASRILYAFSGRQYGLCSITVRPCRRMCYGDVWPSGWYQYGNTWSGSGGYPYPALIGGLWYNLGCAGCSGGCSCSNVSEALLPAPVFDVVQVKIDGVPLVPDVDYRVDNWRVLVRLGGAQWPTCNNLNLADTEVGTWSVTLRVGQPVPELGELAMGVLTTEITKMIMCDASCSLPKPVQSLSRQGVNMTFMDPNELFANGRTGLILPDLFISESNPNGLTQPSGVYDIDDVERDRRLGTS